MTGTLTRDAHDATASKFAPMHRDLVVILRADGVDEDARTIPASLSSEAGVRRFFGTEVLRHTKDAVDLNRAVRGLPLLFNHNRDRPIGRIHDVRVADGRLEGVLHFAHGRDADEFWPMVRDGFLSDMSIGYRVHKWEVDEETETHTAVRWELMEASVVTVPADINPGINRDEEQTMPNTRDDDATVTDLSAVRRQAIAEGRAAGLREERARADGIRSLFAAPRFQCDPMRALCEDLITEGVTIDDARVRLLDAVGQGVEPIAGTRSDTAGAGRSMTSAGPDQLDKFLEAAEQVLAVRGGLERDQAVGRGIRSNECAGMDLTDLAREYLRRGGERNPGSSKMQVVGAAFTRSFVPGSGTSSFANLLANTAEKAILIGWDEAPETWQTWTKEGRLPDFKTADRAGLSGFGSLDEIPSGAEYKVGQMSDLKETIRLVTYGKLFNIARQAIINDDLAAFTEIPMKMGAAANRKVGDVTYEVLSGNPTLNQDATALFDAATHGNLVTSGAAPSVTTLNAGYTAMATQAAPSPDGGTTAGHAINVSPRFLIVPWALKPTAETLVAATYDPAGSAGTLTPNPYQGRLEVVADARLDSFNASGWFLAAAPRSWDTVEVAFLDGERRPFLDQQEGWSVDGVSYKVRIDAGVSPLDYRGLYYNDGVT